MTPECTASESAIGNGPTCIASVLLNPHSEPNPPVRRVIRIVRDHLITLMNSFGIWCDYPQCPSIDPDSLLNLNDLSTAHHPNNLAFHVMPSDTQAPNSSNPSYWPFLNATVHGVMQWLNNRNTAKSEVETTKLICDVILSPNFDAANLVGFDAHQRESMAWWGAFAIKFMKSIHWVFRGHPCSIRRNSHQRQNIQDTSHYSPFKLFYKSPLSGKDECIYSEIFTSDAFLDEAEQVQWHAPVPPEDSTCKHEKVIATMMFSSDATMLTDFSTAKGWPIYFMIGNLSKYIQAH